MKAILNIAWRDFRSLVTSPVYFVLATLFTGLWSALYFNSISAFAQSSATPQQFGGNPGLNLHDTVFLSHISYTNLFFVFMLPALTMRLLSEEKRQRTFDLLLTAPITSVHIAVGKFLGGFAAALTLVSISFLYPLGTALFAEIQWGQLLMAYVGLLMVTGIYVSVGLFASALTDSVLLSVIMGVVFNLILWFITQAIGNQDSATGLAVAEHLNLGKHFVAFLRGPLQLSSIAYFFSLMALFVFLSERIVESARWR